MHLCDEQDALLPAAPSCPFVHSPFWEGEDTALKSFRTVVFGTLPTAGLPFYFNDWDDYTRLIDCFISTGTIETIREIWWDVRPHPDFGTIEIRICDTPATVADAVGITALIQVLVARLCREYERGIPCRRLHSHVIRQNKWRASRYGLDGEFITEAGDRTVKAREALGELVTSYDVPGRGRPESGTRLEFYPVEIDFTSAIQEFHVGRRAAAVPGCMVDTARCLSRPFLNPPSGTPARALC